MRLDERADWQIRTKVLAAGSSGAEVHELRPGEEVSFSGEREIFVVQVNVDPEGETVSRKDKASESLGPNIFQYMFNVSR